MLNADTLRQALKEIYGIEDRYLVPISTNWFLPTVDPKDKIGSWIGYRILSKKPYARAFDDGKNMNKPIKVSFRMTFVGPQAEELADQVLLWEDRTDVTEVFGNIETQINYNSRQAFTYPVRNGGFNDSMAWVVDIDAQTFYKVDTNQKPWF